MQIIRIVADTQLAYAVPITIYGARLVHTEATTAGIYDEAGASAGSPTAALKRIGLAVMANQLTDEAKIPACGIKFAAGCYVEFTAGEVFLTVD